MDIEAKLKEIIDLKKNLHALWQQNIQLERQNKDLKIKNQNLKANSLFEILNKRTINESYFSSTKQQKYRWKKKIESAFFSAGNSALSSYKLAISKIVLNKERPNDNRTIDLKIEE